MTLTPAHGRDYRSATAAKAAFHDNQDFIINEWGHPYDGKPVNRSQLIESGEVSSVKLRYNRLRQATVVQVVG